MAGAGVLPGGAIPMTEPLVCAILLTRDRPEMAVRAVRCFRAQTYYAKKLVVIDTSPKPIDIEGSHVTILSNPTSTSTIGELRNTGNTYASKGLAEQPDILIHWDDDDYSHSNRIAEQVAFLQESGADVVGYSDLLFWRCPPGEAWLYTAPPRGLSCPETTLCYWRKTWERRPFPSATAPAVPNKSEGVEWLAGLNLKMCSSLSPAPRMIATIHGGNTCAKLPPDAGKASQKQWTRVPAWSDYCRDILEGA